ncbi:MAG TPA: hypothetical protein VII63_06960 [Caulobacteraceae bacterium]
MAGLATPFAMSVRVRSGTWSTEKSWAQLTALSKTSRGSLHILAA